MSSQDPIASFVLRFVQSRMNDDSADPPQADWHGVIKHVQSNTERHFARFSDAVSFIASYVSLDEGAEADHLALFPDAE
jgi:hypothetical protein